MPDTSTILSVENLSIDFNPRTHVLHAAREDYLLNHRHMPELYREAMWGTYRGFFDNGIQPDWVHIDCRARQDTGAVVQAGGTLVSEATPGYFRDRGKIGTV